MAAGEKFADPASRLTDSGRISRYLLVGGTTALIQLMLLALLVRNGWPHDLSAALAIVLTTELSFILSSTITWHDRLSTQHWSKRWLLFHVSTGAMAALNILVFFVAQLEFPLLISWAAGISLAGTGNFLLAQYFVFRRAHRPS